MAGIYAAVFVKGATSIREWVAKHNIPQAQEDQQRLHVTVFHTSESTNRAASIERANIVHIAQPDGFTILPHGERRCLALLLKCETLSARFKQFEQMGLQHKYPEFIPHLTLSYDIGDYFNYYDLPPFTAPIILYKERIVNASRRFFHDHEYWTRLQIHLQQFKHTIVETKEGNDHCVLA